MLSSGARVIRQVLAGRPWWMNGLLGFCLYMTFVYMPFDMFVKPVERDVEVWFGIAVHGWAAKSTEPLHWAIYAAGSWGFWRMRRWMWPWAALYVAQIGAGMLVWSVRDPRGPGWLGGVAAAAVFAALAVALWRARSRFVGVGDKSAGVGDKSAGVGGKSAGVGGKSAGVGGKSAGVNGPFV